MLQCLGAQLLVQDVCCGVQLQTHAVGEEVCARGVVGRQIALEMLNVIFRLAVRAIYVLIQRANVESDERGDDEARILAERHDFGHEPAR